MLGALAGRPEEVDHPRGDLRGQRRLQRVRRVDAPADRRRSQLTFYFIEQGFREQAEHGDHIEREQRPARHRFIEQPDRGPGYV